MDERGHAWEPYWQGPTLLGFVEHAEVLARPERPYEKTRQLTLDVVREADLFDAQDDVSRMPTAQVHVTATGEAGSRLASELSEGDWVAARVGEGPLRGTVYRDLDGAESFDQAVDIHPAPARARDRARRLASLDWIPDASPAELETVLRPHGSRLVAVYDVGQGNANAVCIENGAPFLYFDFGGGCLQNARTYPSGRRFCFTRPPPVVLSHWDFDHWFSALREPRILDSAWIVPSGQDVGIRTQKFARTLRHVRRWPGPPALDLGEVAIVRCHGKSKNDSGLALFAPTERGNVLCPGDASFDAISVPYGVRGAALAGLVATHHGSAHHIGGIPRPLPGARLAFSFGEGNSWDHPRASRPTYASEGWQLQLETPRGSVALGSHPRPVPCEGRCTLGTVQ